MRDHWEWLDLLMKLVNVIISTASSHRHRKHDNFSRFGALISGAMFYVRTMFMWGERKWLRVKLPYE